MCCVLEKNACVCKYSLTHTHAHTYMHVESIHLFVIYLYMHENRRNKLMHALMCVYVHTCMCKVIIYTGVDCSEKTPFIQWSKLNDNSSSGYQWGSGSHSNVQWDESLWLFGGYQFPEESSSNETTLAAPLWR